jgi:hypothetical protein
MYSIPSSERENFAEIVSRLARLLLICIEEIARIFGKSRTIFGKSSYAISKFSRFPKFTLHTNYLCTNKLFVYKVCKNFFHRL